MAKDICGLSIATDTGARIVPETVVRAHASVKESFTTPTSVVGCFVVMTQRSKGTRVRKSKAAQALARKLHAKLTPEQRSASARHAALARWAKRRQQDAS